MSGEPGEERRGPGGSAPARRGGEPAASDDSLATLRRIEGLLEDIRNRVDTAARVQRHREFSLARLIGALLQALVVGLIIAAVADWAFQAPAAQRLITLMFAGVLQLGVLTAFVVAREAR